MMGILEKIIPRLGRSYVGNYLLKSIVRLYDSALCTTEVVIKQASKCMESTPCLRFSVAIPHYNRGYSIARPLRNLLNHPGVAEVVIVDDGSHNDHWQSLEREVGRIPHAGKIRLYRRKNNVGALRTKFECVERSLHPWVLVLDSDNTAFVNYLDALSALDDPRKDTIYCASWAFPFFPFHELGNDAITFERAYELSKNGSLRRIYIINDGNYLVPRDEYLRYVEELTDMGNHAADVLLVNYRWLSVGNRIELMPSTSYLHRIDGSSFWENTREHSKAQLIKLLDKLNVGERWSRSFSE